ncbi:MAG: FecR family protein [Mariniphaga sp.]
MKKYKDYSVEDLLHDQEFISIVKRLDSPEEWEQFLQYQSEAVNNIIHARKILHLFQTSEDKILDKEKNQKLWDNISRFNTESSRHNKTISLKTFIRVAASILIIISLGGLLYLHFSKIENHYQFSESRNDLKSDNPLLVLSNGNTVKLKKSESKIEVLKGKDAIQIDNDQIIENQSPNVKATNNAKLNEVIIPFGKKSKIVLEDGTTVWLNAGSRFAFPQAFNGNKREVFLEGEAYFEVAKNIKMPFIVTTAEINVEVLGTRFNICAYKADNLCETVLFEGSVNIWDNSKYFKEKIQIVPNQKATYDKTRKNIALKSESESESGRIISWVNGWYEFKNEDFEQVLKKLEKYYNIKFEYDQAEVSKILPVSGKLDLKESLNEVMIVLSKVAKIEYQISGKIVTIKINIKQPMRK